MSGKKPSPLAAVLKDIRVIPVMTVHDPDEAFETARALASGGFSVLEITLRTTHAWPALERMQNELPELVLGVGTVTETEQLEQASENGARFAVSAFLNESLIEESQRLRLPYLPAVETTSEVDRALKYGCNTLKLFPAEAMNGLNRLKDFQPVFPETKFIPTGGMNQQNFRDYLSLSNVLAVGGGWMMPGKLVARKDWQGITELAHRINNLL